MDYEQKYKEALERAKSFQEKYGGDYAGYIFPELAESEDEKIRKWLVDYFKEVGKSWIHRDINPEQILTYLEKQKENPKTSDSISPDCTPDAKCGNRDSNYGVFPEDVLTVARACEKLEAHGYPELAYALKNVNLFTSEKQKEQIPYTDFVIKPHNGDDNNPYDMRVSEAQEYAIKRGFGIPFNDGEVYVDERHMTQTIGNILRWADEHPKEQKPAEWSEEDEKILQSIIEDFRAGKVSIIGQEQWLKSLRPSWKPSEEQDAARRK